MFYYRGSCGKLNHIFHYQSQDDYVLTKLELLAEVATYIRRQLTDKYDIDYTW